MAGKHIRGECAARAVGMTQGDEGGLAGRAC